MKGKNERGGGGKPPPLSLSARHARRPITFQDDFLDDLAYWIRTHPRTASRILELVRDVRRDPFTGIGKPEPLKHELRGCWSRRVTGEHRIVYRVDEGQLDFLSARYHY